MYEFNEKQKFNQWWIWIFLTLMTVLCTWGAMQQLVFKIPFGNKPASDRVLVLICLFPLLFVYLFSTLRLETKINSEGVFYRFKPFHFKEKIIRWEEIEKIYTRQYNPIKEYGGWGIKGSFRKGKAYNVSGNQGIQLELKNGKKILLGTKKQSSVEATLLQLKKT